MKKILCLFSILLLVSCANESVENASTETVGTEVAESNLSTDSQDISSGQEKIGDIPSMLQKLPDVYMQDENFKFCVAQNVDACISDFIYQNPDISSCDDFITESGREMCNATQVTSQARQEESLVLCESLPIDSANSCKNEVAIAIWLKTWEVKTCDSLADWYIVECKNQIITSNAISSRDVSLCDDIITSDESFNYEKDFCIQEIAMQIENDEFEKQQLEEQERIMKEQEAEMLEMERQMAEEQELLESQ